MLPFYDKGYWFKPGIVKTLLDGMSALSIASKVVALPVCIIAFIKYNSINKELIRYNTINPNLPKPKDRYKNGSDCVGVINCCVSYIESDYGGPRYISISCSKGFDIGQCSKQ